MRSVAAPRLLELAALELILVAGADSGGVTAGGVHEPGPPVLLPILLLVSLHVNRVVWKGGVKEKVEAKKTEREDLINRFSSRGKKLLI